MGKADRQIVSEQVDSTGDMDTEQDENDAPKDNVASSVDERMKAFEKEEKEEAVRKKEEKKDIEKVNQGMKAFNHEADHQEQEEERGDSTGEMNTEQDENDAPKDNVALSVDERMKAFENEEKEEKEEAARKKEEKKDIKKVNQGMKAFDHEADRQIVSEQVDSTGEMDTEQDENDAPKDNVALSVDERMKAFEKEEKEEAVRKKEE